MNSTGRRLDEELDRHLSRLKSLDESKGRGMPDKMYQLLIDRENVEHENAINRITNENALLD